MTRKSFQNIANVLFGVFHMVYDMDHMIWFDITEPLPFVTVIHQKDKHRCKREYTEH